MAAPMQRKGPSSNKFLRQTTMVVGLILLAYLSIFAGSIRIIFAVKVKGTSGISSVPSTFTIATAYVHNNSDEQQQQQARNRKLDSYCVNNATRAECCSPHQCELVRQSTLYSPCCHNILPAMHSAKTKNRKRPRLIPILITATPRSGTVFVHHLLRRLGIYAIHDSRAPPYPSTTAVMVSWMHVMKEPNDQYYGPAKLYGAKFQYMWHQTRDPLKALTSMAFTEHLDNDTNSEMAFVHRHVQLTRLHDVPKQIQDQQLLIYRGMEFYVQWNDVLLNLKLPRFSLEDLTDHPHDFTAIYDIFDVLHKDRPSVSEIQKAYNATVVRTSTTTYTERRRRRLQMHDALGRPLRRDKNRDRTNARIHRKTLEWNELCFVDAPLAQHFLDVSHRLGYYKEKVEACT